MQLEYQLTNVRFIPSRRILIKDGGDVKLTPTECQILALLCDAGDEPLSAESLLAAIWPEPGDVGRRKRFDTHLTNLKRHLKPWLPKLIRNTPGSGYSLTIRPLRFGSATASGTGDKPLRETMPLEEFNLHLMTEPLGGTLERESRLYIVGCHPIETQQPYAERLLASMLDGMISPLVFLSPLMPNVIASLLCEMVEAARRVPVEPQIELQRRPAFLAVLAHLRIIVTPYLGANSEYILNPTNPHKAKTYAYHCQERTAIETAAYGDSVRHAERIHRYVPEKGHSVVQCCNGFADCPVLFEGLRAQVSRRLKPGESELLDALIPATAPVRRRPARSAAGSVPGKQPGAQAEAG